MSTLKQLLDTLDREMEYLILSGEKHFLYVLINDTCLWLVFSTLWYKAQGMVSLGNGFTFAWLILGSQ